MYSITLLCLYTCIYTCISAKLSLPVMRVESFIDLMTYTGRDSVGIVEVFTALLRILLRDKRVGVFDIHTVCMCIPFSV